MPGIKVEEEILTKKETYNMKQLTAKKYRELFKLRAEGKLDDMECTKNLYKLLKPLYFNGIKILDVPCGVGHYFRKIKELGGINY